MDKWYSGLDKLNAWISRNKIVTFIGIIMFFMLVSTCSNADEYSEKIPRDMYQSVEKGWVLTLPNGRALSCKLRGISAGEAQILKENPHLAPMWCVATPIVTWSQCMLDNRDSTLYCREQIGI